MSLTLMRVKLFALEDGQSYPRNTSRLPFRKAQYIGTWVTQDTDCFKTSCESAEAGRFHLRFSALAGRKES